MLENPLYMSFVNPKLCRALYDFGLNVPTPFKWKLEGDLAYLTTQHFDDDRYYEQARANVKFIQQEILRPAFQVDDMIKVLPKFTLEKNGNEYTLVYMNGFGKQVDTGKRLPDLFASSVLKGLQNETIDVVTAYRKLITI